MAQNLELIVGLLREMKKANNTNSESFDKLLASINNKLEVVDKNSASADLLSTYLSELAKALDEKYSTTLSRLSDIENALKTSVETSDKKKYKKLHQIFESFTEEMNRFHAEANQQKVTVAGIENIIATLTSDKLNKKDLDSAISLLKKDFKDLNNGYKTSIDTINEKLNSVLLQMMSQDSNKNINEQIEVMHKATNEIVNYLTSMDRRDTNLEKLLENTITNENLKTSQEIIEVIIENSDKISKKLNNLANKTDIKNLKSTVEDFGENFDDSAVKEICSKISDTTDKIINQTVEIKQTLTDMTKNIESNDDTKAIEKSLQDLHIKVEELTSNINNIDSHDSISEDTENKISSIISELSTVKNLVSDLNEIISNKISNSINDISFETQCFEIKSHVSKMLSEVPQKEDIDRIIESQDNITDLLENVATKQDIENNTSKTNDLINSRINNLKFDKEFNDIYNKTSSIEEWLIQSKVKENSEEILAQIPEKAKQKDLIEILSTTKKIADNLEEMSVIPDINKINSTVSEVQILIEDLKTDFLNTTDLHNESVISSVSELQNSLANIVTAEDFDSFVEDLKAFVIDYISKNSEIDSNIELIRKIQESIINKLETLNLDSVIEILNAKNLDYENRIINISDHIEKNLKINNEFVTENIRQIKEILENKNSNLSDIDKKQIDSINLIEEYIKEIKTILDTKDNEIDAILKNNFADIEEKIESRKIQSEENLQQTLIKIDDLSSMIQTEKSICTGELQNSLSEILEIKEQIAKLGESFNALNYDKGSEENIVSSFVSEKLLEISTDLQNISKNFDEKMHHGFTYQAELIEEKTATLLDLIKELRHNNSENIDLYERLTVTDNKLMDFKQELDLVNTDIINNLNSKTEQIIADLSPIKEALLNIMSNNFNGNTDINSIMEKLQDIHETIQEDLKECTQHSQSTYDRLEETYTKISNEITSSENNLKDFILTDIDSVIIKIDNLRSDLEESLNRISPPEAEHMAEFRAFVDEIKNFKQAQNDFLTETASDIKTAISTQLENQQEELMSILKVSTNNNQILSAIDDLKEILVSRINTYSNITEEQTQDVELGDDFGINIYEQEFEQTKESEVLEEIKADFIKFTDLIGDLSDQNPEICEVLENIKNKMETVSIRRIESSENQEIGENDIVEDYNNQASIIGANNFDVLQALNLLKEDIHNLQNQVTKIIPENEQVKLLSSQASIPSLGSPIGNSANIGTIVQNLKQDWLNEIQNYLAENDIKTLLEEINDKVNILTLTDNSEWVEDIKNSIENLNNIDISTLTESNNEIRTMMAAINEKVDILATTDLTEEVEDIRYTLENIDNKLEEISDVKKLSESDAKITAMLETLNHKIDIIASSSDTEFALDEVRDLIIAQQDSIDNLEQNNKTEAFKKCLDELTQEVNNITGNNSQEIQRSLKDMKESIMSAVVTIFEQISFIEESEDIKDFVEEKTDEINKNLAAVTEQLKQITQADPDYTYSMQDIESDLAKLRLALNELQSSEQDAKEAHLASILENITQMSSTVQGLQVASGESYNAINNFGRDITTYLSNKVDNVAKLVEQSHNSDKVMRQALIYMGEWIDSASESMEKISTNSEEIIDIKSAIDDLKESIPEHTVILSSIKNKFDEQEERIDRLEMALEKILSAVEDIDDTKVTRKIDKIDKQLIKLSTNIEKLASYVD